MKKIHTFLLFLPVLALCIALLSCSDDNEDPTLPMNNIVGYWAISHIQEIKHSSEGHDTYDQEIPPTYLDSNTGENQPRWNILIFDEEFATVRGDMPNRPKQSEYDNDATGQIMYITDIDSWNNAIGSYTDNYGCPVGKYFLKGNDLIIGNMNMGTLTFKSENEFTLDFKKSIDDNNYIRRIYTYSRIHSLY